MFLQVVLVTRQLSYRSIPKSDYEEAKKIIERQILAEMGLDARVYVLKEAPDEQD